VKIGESYGDLKVLGYGGLERELKMREVCVG